MRIIEKYNLFHHIYADDVCLFFSFSPTEIANSVFALENCIHHLCDWFNTNRLKINGSKTNFMLFNRKTMYARIYINVCGTDVYPSSTISYLGVTLDEFLSFEQHVIDVCRSSFAFLRNFYRIRNYLPMSSVLSIANAFLFSCMDYCNSILSFCNKRTIGRLQRVQNGLVRLVKRLPRRTPTSQAIKETGWLRINDRIIFKICCFVHKCVYGSSPAYVNDLISFSHSLTSSILLRSHSSSLLFAPISQIASVRRAFCFQGPRLWNTLPLSIRLEPRYNVFKRELKAHLISQ